MNADGLSSFSSRVFVKCPLKIDVGYLETKIFIVFEDHPAISKHVQIFYEDCRKRAKSVKQSMAKESRHAMLSGVFIVLTADCCHATLFHPAQTFTTVCSFNPVKNPIKSHKTAPQPGAFSDIFWRYAQSQ